MTKSQASFNLPYAIAGADKAARRFKQLSAAGADGARLRSAAFEWRTREQLVHRLETIANS